MPLCERPVRDLTLEPAALGKGVPMLWLLLLAVFVLIGAPADPGVEE